MVLFGFMNAYSICKRWRSFLGVDRLSFHMYHAAGMAGPTMHGTLLLVFWHDPSTVDDLLQWPASHPVWGQTAVKYIFRETRAFHEKEEVTCHSCASSVKFLSGGGDFSPA
jgi:hypothetical protein